MNRERAPFPIATPTARAYALVVAGLLVAVLVAGAVSGNPLAYVIAGVVVVFVGVPALALTLAARAERRRDRAAHNGHVAGAPIPPEREAPLDEEGTPP